MQTLKFEVSWLLCCHPSLCDWFQPIQEVEHGLLQIDSSKLNVFLIKSIYIIYCCVFLDPAT